MMEAKKQSSEAVKSDPPYGGSRSPYYFLALEVENVRSFKEPQKLLLADARGRPRRWTVLLGDNGVGKTTLLQVLASFQARQIMTHTIKGEVVAIILPHLFVEKQAYSSFLRGESDRLSCKADFCYGTKFTDASGVIKRLSLDVNISADSPSGCTGQFPTEEGNFVCYGYGAGRRMSQHALAESRSGDTCKTLFDEGEPLLNAEEWLLQADYAAVKLDSQPASRRRDEIKKVLTQLLPDVEELRIRPGGDSLKSPAVEAKTPYGWVSLRNLSSGYRSLVAWLVDLASRLFDAYPDSSNPLAEPAVVLVDQIDLFLHPKWQLSLISRLVELFPNAQFITTAHSPLIVQAAEDTNIVVLRREGDHVVIDNDPAHVRGWRIDQVLTSDIFGLTSTRDSKTEDALRERRSLLSKPILSETERARLEQLNEHLAGLPFVESQEDAEAMEVIRKAADRLRRPAEVK